MFRLHRAPRWVWLDLFVMSAFLRINLNLDSRRWYGTQRYINQPTYLYSVTYYYMHYENVCQIYAKRRNGHLIVRNCSQQCVSHNTPPRSCVFVPFLNCGVHKLQHGFTTLRHSSVDILRRSERCTHSSSSPFISLRPIICWFFLNGGPPILIVSDRKLSISLLAFYHFHDCLDIWL